MSTEHVGYIVQIKELKEHSNADKLQLAIIFGESVIVGKDVQIGDLGVFFPVDLQLSEEYCNINDLVRRKNAEGNPAGGYLDPRKRNIRAMKFRGERSEGLFMPLESLTYTGVTKFEVGQTIDTLNGHEICRKYIPKGSKPHTAASIRKKKIPIAPLFAEHADTEQLAYHLDDFQPGDLIEITLKMHGTSGRTGRLPVLQGYKRTLLDKIFHREGTPVYDWGYISGTRRVVLSNFDGGFYGDNSFREQHAKFFEGKLHKGETVFYEIVGFTDDGVPIMPIVANSKISDKEFTKKYGQATIFSYGCNPKGKILKRGEDDEGDFYLPVEVPKSDCYVYRMTCVNEDGEVVEYPPDYVRYRCEQMGAKYVPLLWRGIIPQNTWIDTHSAGEWIKNMAEDYYDGPDPIGKTHVREGVVIRIVDKPKFCAYKHKNFCFKVLEGIAKDLASEPDMEEAQEEI